jgi:2,4-diketo-3-deoxy-L-fuconate hydrolase
MKLLRHGPRGQERPGVLDADGRGRELSAVLTGIAGAVLTAAGLARLRGIDLSALPGVQHQRVVAA